MNEKNRPTGMGPAQILAGGSNTPSLQAPSTSAAEPAALIGATVEARLASELERLIADEISLDDFTPALQGFVLHGHRLALASLLPEYTRLELALERANSDSARPYSALFNPREPVHFGPSYAELEATRRATYARGAE